MLHIQREQQSVGFRKYFVTVASTYTPSIGHIMKNCGLRKETEYYLSAQMKPADPDK
jgi:hypothetical protein